MLIAYLFATALIALALTRLPGAIRGRNIRVMFAAVAIVIAFVLITPAVYSFLTPLLPVPNLVDLLSKLALFLGLLLACTQIARAYSAPAAERLIAGPIGLTVFALLFTVEVLIFSAVYTSTPLPGLEGDLEDMLVRVYAAVATAYAAYVSLALLPTLWNGVNSRNRSTRTTSLLLFVGFGLAVIRVVLALVTLVYLPIYAGSQVVSGVAAVFVALGLAHAFFGRVIRTRRSDRWYTSA